MSNSMSKTEAYERIKDIREALRQAEAGVELGRLTGTIDFMAQARDMASSFVSNAEEFGINKCS